MQKAQDLPLCANAACKIATFVVVCVIENYSIAQELHRWHEFEQIYRMDAFWLSAPIGEAMPVSKYFTVVVRMPEGEADKQQVEAALKALEPFRTGMSLEDEMTVLELIEEHPDFDRSIGDEARRGAQKLHRLAEAN